MEPCIYKTCPNQDALYEEFTPKLNWDIMNCPNITEGTYQVSL